MKELNFEANGNFEAIKAIQAFTDPAMLKDWWGVEKTLIRTFKGGPYILTWDISEKGIGFISSGVIESFVKDSEITIGNMHKSHIWDL